MRVDVTEEDILNGTPMNCNACPVALALKRVSPGMTWSVNRISIKLIGIGGRLMSDLVVKARFRTPDQVRRFMLNFDGGDMVSAAPFSFDLPIESEAAQ